MFLCNLALSSTILHFLGDLRFGFGAEILDRLGIRLQLSSKLKEAVNEMITTNIHVFFWIVSSNCTDILLAGLAYSQESYEKNDQTQSSIYWYSHKPRMKSPC